MDIQKELLLEFDQECAKTRKILEAIPDGVDFGWKPHEKSMPLGILAGHVVDCLGDWGQHALTLDKLEFPADHKWEPYRPTSRAEIVERLDKGVVATRSALASLTPEKWEQNWKFIFGGQVWLDDTRYRIFRASVLDHMIHHRAQLGVYLRLLGAKIPGSYGPSADEM